MMVPIGNFFDERLKSPPRRSIAAARRPSSLQAQRTGPGFAASLPSGGRNAGLRRFLANTDGTVQRPEPAPPPRPADRLAAVAAERDFMCAARNETP